MNMNQYTIQMMALTGGLNWQYFFTESSDDLAREFTKRVLQYDPAARTALAVLLFRVTPTEEAIARYTIEQPVTVKETTIRP